MLDVDLSSGAWAEGLVVLQISGFEAEISSCYFHPFKNANTNLSLTRSSRWLLLFKIDSVNLLCTYHSHKTTCQADLSDSCFFAGQKPFLKSEGQDVVVEGVTTDSLRVLILMNSRGATTQRAEVTGTCSEDRRNSSDLQNQVLVTFLQCLCQLCTEIPPLLSVYFKALIPDFSTIKKAVFRSYYPAAWLPLHIAWDNVCKKLGA